MDSVAVRWIRQETLSGAKFTREKLGGITVVPTFAGRKVGQILKLHEFLPPSHGVILHALGTLSLGKKPPIPTEQEVGSPTNWTKYGGKEKS
jgi:hypothetical protein